MSDAQHTIGHILETEMDRDAIHVAIAPIVARVTLYPGQPVGANGDTTNPVGIVDPFLTHPVIVGKRCWLFLYPGTVTSLRHEWTHPAFGGPAPPMVKDEERSRSWLQSFADRYEMSEAEIIDAARNYVERREYLIDGSRFEGEDVPDEFWEHYERVTGHRVPEKDKSNFFSCSC